MRSGVAASQNSGKCPQTIRHRITIWSSNFTSEYTPKRLGSRDSKRYAHPCPQLYSKHPKDKVTLASIATWMNEQNVVSHINIPHNTAEYYSVFF